MSDRCYIGIDTSNYTTSVAVATEGGQIIANLKAPLAVKKGECGLRQSDAVFSHVKNLPALLDQLSALTARLVPVAVGVSAKPRDAEDSYMPCFLSGVAAASAYAAALHLPLHRFSHQSGHVMAALYGASAQHVEGAPFGAFHVSGGTTDLLYAVKSDRGFDVTNMGGSADLHAGQAIDRIGVALGLDFPCGPALEELAKGNTKKLPPIKISAKDGVCHLSGLENLAMKLYRDTGDAAQVADFTQRFLAKTLLCMAKWLREQKGEIPIVFGGGVMSNRFIADTVQAELDNVYFSDPAFAADNAAGIALLCRRAEQA